MATSIKRGNSYRITAYSGYDINGKQIRKSMTWTPPSAMTPKQIEKELKRQEILFQEQCDSGQVAIKGDMKFSQFADIWFQDREGDLRPTTFARYKSLLPRINAAIGHLKLSKIQPQHLRAFYKNLAEGGIRLDTKYRCIIDLKEHLRRKKMTKAELSRCSGVAVNTISSIINGGNTPKQTAERLCKTLELPFEKTFEADKQEKRLSAETVNYHHRLISSVLSTAVEWDIITSNPCSRTKPLKVPPSEPRYLDEIQAAKLLELLENENITRKTYIYFCFYTGARRGEVSGLKWSDIDFENKTVYICRTLQYLPNKGLFEDETKTQSSTRVVPISANLIRELKAYRKWQITQQMKMGDMWQNDADYIFTTDEGKPLHPDTMSSWFRKFINAHRDELPYITLHSLRHTNATLLIANHTQLSAVADRLGHNDISTTARIYTHAVMSASRGAADTLDSLFAPKSNKEAI